MASGNTGWKQFRIFFYWYDNLRKRLKQASLNHYYFQVCPRVEVFNCFIHILHGSDQIGCDARLGSNKITFVMLSFCLCQNSSLRPRQED